MNLLLKIYILFLGFSAVTCLVIMLYLRKMRQGPGSMWFSILLASMALWAGTAALEKSFADLGIKILLSKIQYLGVISAPASYLLFAARYSHRDGWLSWRTISFLWVIPISILILAATNEFHNLIWSGFTPSPLFETVYIFNHGPVFWIWFVYINLYLVFGTIFLLDFGSKLPAVYRKQFISLSLSAVVPWIGNILFITGLTKNLDITPLSFTITGFLLSYNVSKNRLFDLVPIAREILFENMNDGVIILDDSGRVADANPAAYRLLGIDTSAKLCQSIHDFWPSVPEALIDKNTIPENTIKTRINDNINRIIEIQCSNINDKFPIGKILMFKDITESEQVFENLTETNKQLNIHVTEIEKLEKVLREQAIRDPLTALYNRRYFDKILELEIARATEENGKFGLVMIDLDRFKTFNDRYGHNAGDTVLKFVAEFLKEQTRRDDIVCRYGGEEFFVIMLGVQMEDAQRRVNDWRISLAKADIPFENHIFHVELSAGIAIFPDHAENQEKLLKAVDIALYKAKKSGRNLVICAEKDKS